MALVYAAVISSFDLLQPMQQLPEPPNVRVYRRRDLSEEATDTLYRSFDSVLVDRYLREKEVRWAAAPIIRNAAIIEALRES